MRAIDAAERQRAGADRGRITIGKSWGDNTRTRTPKTHQLLEIFPVRRWLTANLPAGIFGKQIGDTLELDIMRRVGAWSVGPNGTCRRATGQARIGGGGRRRLDSEFFSAALGATQRPMGAVLRQKNHDIYVAKGLPVPKLRIHVQYYV